jgi:ATP-dependent Clp protease ATP-binding subunit ClpA
MGARPLGRKIDELIRVPLSKRILADRLRDCVLMLDLVQEQISITVQAPEPVSCVDADGYIVLDQFKPK